SVGNNPGGLASPPGLFWEFPAGWGNTGGFDPRDHRGENRPSRQGGRKAGSRHHPTPQNRKTASERRQKRHVSGAAHATTNRYPEDMHTELRVTLPGPKGQQMLVALLQC